MRLLAITCTLFLLTITTSFVSAQSKEQEKIEDFKLVEENGKLKIKALEESDEQQVNEKVNGEYIFGINGMDVALEFRRGEANLSQQFSGSTFVYFSPKHQPVSSVKLYYLQEISDYYGPFKIPISLLLIIPLIFIIIGYFVRKLIFLFIGILVAFFLFNKGLDIGNYFAVLWSWLT
ncbi:hypothetical protein C3K47_13135 [Solitalea longa]|uniref:Uncharacterized protein n=1 Tax=Solitalea longa TaxID=2079460 RepID=A0A2S5A1Z5_9SPHI|nr:hypothetical protein [Solitalea longa]POY36133.1 hypothetical protein C3K47_13135 [Solitalea longa]